MAAMRSEKQTGLGRVEQALTEESEDTLRTPVYRTNAVDLAIGGLVLGRLGRVLGREVGLPPSLVKQCKTLA